jgi:hypothetical protein
VQEALRCLHARDGWVHSSENERRADALAALGRLVEARDTALANLHHALEDGQNAQLACEDMHQKLTEVRAERDTARRRVAELEEVRREYRDWTLELVAERDVAIQERDRLREELEALGRDCCGSRGRGEGSEAVAGASAEEGSSDLDGAPTTGEKLLSGVALGLGHTAIIHEGANASARARLERVEAATTRLYDDVTAQLENEADSANSAFAAEAIERVRLAFGAPYRALAAALSDVTPPPSGAAGAVDE